MEEKIPFDEIEKRVREALRFVELERTYDMFPSELSGGMRRRVAIARAIITQPEVLLYDSPTGGLDPVTSNTIVELIMKQRDVYKTSALMVTHRLQDAFTMATHQFDQKENKMVALPKGQLCEVPMSFLILRDSESYLRRGRAPARYFTRRVHPRIYFVGFSLRKRAAAFPEIIAAEIFSRSRICSPIPTPASGAPFCLVHSFPAAPPDFHACVRGSSPSSPSRARSWTRRTCRADDRQPPAPSASARLARVPADPSARDPIQSSRSALPASARARLFSSFGETDAVSARKSGELIKFS